MSQERLAQFVDDFGKYDYEVGRYLDTGLAIYAYRSVVNKMPAIEQ